MSKLPSFKERLAMGFSVPQKHPQQSPPKRVERKESAGDSSSDTSSVNEERQSDSWSEKEPVRPPSAPAVRSSTKGFLSQMLEQQRPGGELAGEKGILSQMTLTWWLQERGIDASFARELLREGFVRPKNGTDEEDLVFVGTDAASLGECVPFCEGLTALPEDLWATAVASAQRHGNEALLAAAMGVLSPGRLVGVFRLLLKQQALHSDEEGPDAFLFAFVSRVQLSEMLRRVLHPSAVSVMLLPAAFVIDPNRLLFAEMLEGNVMNLKNTAGGAVRRLSEELRTPQVQLRVLRQWLEVVQQQLGVEAAILYLSARLLEPALVAPTVFGVTVTPASVLQRRSLGNVGMVVRHILTGRAFPPDAAAALRPIEEWAAGMRSTFRAAYDSFMASGGGEEAAASPKKGSNAAATVAACVVGLGQEAMAVLQARTKDAEEYQSLEGGERNAPLRLLLRCHHAAVLSGERPGPVSLSSPTVSRHPSKASIAIASGPDSLEVAMQAREAAETLTGERKDELLGLLDTLIQGGCPCAACGNNAGSSGPNSDRSNSDRSLRQSATARKKDSLPQAVSSSAMKRSASVSSERSCEK